LASGEYLRFLCSDDVLAPECLRDEIAAMEANTTAVLLSSTARRLTPTGEVLGTHADHFPPGLYPGAASVAGILWFRGEYGYNPLNYPSGILLRTVAARQAGMFDETMHMAADLDFFFRVLRTGDLLIVDRHGCDLTIHPAQEGAALSGRVEVMEEEYVLLHRFGALLGTPRALRHVTNQIGGLCLRFALGGWRHGDWESARRHLALARAHGSGLAVMAMACLRILTVRTLLARFGVRRLPKGMRASYAPAPADRGLPLRPRAITDSRK
jgi:hypothetical protein